MRPQHRARLVRPCIGMLLLLCAPTARAQNGSYPAQAAMNSPVHSADAGAYPQSAASHSVASPQQSAATQWNAQPNNNRPQLVPNSPPQDSLTQEPQHRVVTASDSQPIPNLLIGQSSGLGSQDTGGTQLSNVGERKSTPLTPSTKAEDAAQSRKSGGTLQALVSIGSSLAIVMGLVFGVAWFYRKTLNTSLGASLPKQVVDVLGRTPIATRQQLVLVRFGSKLVLVSMVQGEARTISEITDPLEVDQLAGLCESAKPGSITQSFRSVLSQGGTS